METKCTIESKIAGKMGEKYQFCRKMKVRKKIDVIFWRKKTQVIYNDTRVIVDNYVETVDFSVFQQFWTKINCLLFSKKMKDENFRN